MSEEKKLSVEDSFNLIVQLARNAKLSWAEHRQVHTAVETVYTALKDSNKDLEEEPEE
jgi:hypothetical protein